MTKIDSIELLHSKMQSQNLRRHCCVTVAVMV